MGTEPQPEQPRMTDVICFLRLRLDELEAAEWHTMDCGGFSGPSGSCCAARAMATAQARAMRERIGRYIHAVSQAGAASEAAEWWEGVMTALWMEARADAALWHRHADYRQAWKDPAGLAP